MIPVASYCRVSTDKDNAAWEAMTPEQKRRELYEAGGAA